MHELSDDRNGGVVQLKVPSNDAHRNFVTRFYFGEPRVGIVVIARHKYDDRTRFRHNVPLQSGLSDVLHHTREDHAFHRIADLIFIHDLKCDRTVVAQIPGRIRHQLGRPGAHIPLRIAFAFVLVR